MRTDTVARFGSASRDQAVIYLLRPDTLVRKRDAVRRGWLDTEAPPISLCLRVPTLNPGTYRVCAWDTANGRVLRDSVQTIQPGDLFTLPPLVTDIAIAFCAAEVGVL